MLTLKKQEHLGTIAMVKKHKENIGGEMPCKTGEIELPGGLEEPVENGGLENRHLDEKRQPSSYCAPPSRLSNLSRQDRLGMTVLIVAFYYKRVYNHRYRNYKALCGSKQ